PSSSLLSVPDTHTTVIEPLSLHDALPIYNSRELQRDDLDRGRKLCEVLEEAIGGLPQVHLSTPHQGVSIRTSVFLGKLQPHSSRSEEHTSELQSRFDIVCRLLLEKKKPTILHWHRSQSMIRAPSPQLDIRTEWRVRSCYFTSSVYYMRTTTLTRLRQALLVLSSTA